MKTQTVGAKTIVSMAGNVDYYWWLSDQYFGDDLDLCLEYMKGNPPSMMRIAEKGEPERALTIEEAREFRAAECMQQRYLQWPQPRVWVNPIAPDLAMVF